MRACQICDSEERVEIQADYCHADRPPFQAMQLYECQGCGFRYVDALELSQAWFDRYYSTEYKTSDDPYSVGRWTSLSAFLAERASDVLDVGGMDGKFHQYVKGKYQAVGVGFVPERKYEAVVLSHTLEHVYDIHELLTRVCAALPVGGWLVVEVPIHLRYVDPERYDCHFQHVNKFRPKDLEKLFNDHVLEMLVSQKIDEYREYSCWRIAGKYARGG